MIKYLEKEEDFKSAITNKILVDFYADWCGPCKRMGAILEEIEGIEILKVNVDLFPNIAKNYGIMSIPTLILFENGQEINKMIGFQSLDAITELLK